MTPEGRSPLATWVDWQTPAPTVRAPWGLLFHTTGRGLPAKAARTGRPVLELALDTYRKSQDGRLHGYKVDPKTGKVTGYRWGGPTYVLPHDGKLIQVADERIMTHHCGGPGARALYVSGKWVEKSSPQMVARWHAQWGPKYRHPNQLFPSSTPNVDYVGVEMIPCGSGLGEPMRPGLLFTEAQHRTCAALAVDMGARYRWPAGWWRTPRLLGHEDVQPLPTTEYAFGRGDAKGGWDPGFLRAQPFFDFDFVRDLVGDAHNTSAGHLDRAAELLARAARDVAGVFDT